MAKGIALHIGVNIVDPEHYSGWSGPLECCEADADVMEKISTSLGYDVTVYKTAAATRESVSDFIREAASKLESGDTFFLSYSGHGGQVKDVDGDEEDGKDETWCLFDGQLLDDELEILWSLFAEGTRVIVLSDSCHSGTVTKDTLEQDQPEDAGEPRMMPRADMTATYRKNRDFYAQIQYDLPNPRPPLKTTVRLFSGCQDDQLSYEAKPNGRFTTAISGAFEAGEFGSGYADFYQAILKRMPEYQTPNHFVIGEPNSEFDASAAFAI